jgi:hypothetical protein
MANFLRLTAALVLLSFSMRHALSTGERISSCSSQVKRGCERVKSSAFSGRMWILPIVGCAFGGLVGGGSSPLPRTDAFDFYR